MSTLVVGRREAVGWGQTSSLFAHALGKEVRALLPLWAFALVAPALLLFLSQTEGWGDGGFWAEAAFAAGCALLGTLSFGHEVNHRTFGLLLAQPEPRWKIYGRKQLVLFAALTTSLAAFGVAGLVWGGPDFEATDTISRSKLAAQYLLPFVCGWLGGPFLTLLLRHTLAGIVFSVAVPLTLWVGSVAGVAAWLKLHGESSEGFDSPGGLISQLSVEEGLRLRLWSLLLLVYWVVSGVGGWLLFQRMQVVDSTGRTLALPGRALSSLVRLARRLAPGRGGMLGHLLPKELHLQQASFLMTSLAVLAWVANVLAKIARPEFDSSRYAIEMALIMMLTATCIGALACAEERSLGSLEWHLMLPITALKQWGVKCARAFVLSWVLAAGLPLVLIGITPASVFESAGLRIFEANGHLSDMVLLMFAASTIWTAAGLYASTLTNTTVKAMLLAFGLTIGIGALAIFAGGNSQPRLPSVLAAAILEFWLEPFNPSREFLAHLATTLIYAQGVVLLAVLLTLGYRNFRHVNQRVTTFAAQVAGITLMLVGFSWTMRGIVEVLNNTSFAK